MGRPIVTDEAKLQLRQAIENNCVLVEPVRAPTRYCGELPTQMIAKSKSGTSNSKPRLAMADKDNLELRGLELSIDFLAKYLDYKCYLRHKYGLPESGYVSGCGRKPDYVGAGSEFGLGCGQRTEHWRPSESGSGSGGRTESEYGSVYGRSEGQDSPGPSNGRRADEGSGYGGDSSYGSNGGDSSYGSDGGDPSNGSDGGDPSNGSDGGDSGDSSNGSEESYGRNRNRKRNICMILKRNMRKTTTTRTNTKRQRTVETADLFLMVVMPPQIGR